MAEETTAVETTAEETTAEETTAVETVSQEVEDVIEALRDVVDPELGINVVDLGLVYGVDVDAEKIATVDMTLTSAACPLTDVIEEQAREALDGLVTDFRINWVWMPPVGPGAHHRRRPRTTPRPRLQHLASHQPHPLRARDLRHSASWPSLRTPRHLMHEITTCDRSLDLEMVISCIRQTDVATVTRRGVPKEPTIASFPSLCSPGDHLQVPQVSHATKNGHGGCKVNGCDQRDESDSREQLPLLTSRRFVDAPTRMRGLKGAQSGHHANKASGNG